MCSARRRASHSLFVFLSEMTYVPGYFVKVDSKESEIAALREYAALKDSMRKRARWERLSHLVDYDPGPRPPPFEEELNAKIEKNKNNDVVSNNDSALGGGVISTSTSKNNYAATDVTSVPRVFEKKKAKNSKATSTSQQRNNNASSSSINVTAAPRRKTTKENKKKWSKSPQNVVESNVKKKKHLYTTLQPKFLRKNTSSSISRSEGGGVIQFLPSDVRSLRKQLAYQIAEYKAGNRSLKNEIAAILKNLHNRKVMTKREYNTQINSILR